MQATPPVHGFVNDRHIDEADDTEDGGGTRASRGASHIAAQHQVADVDKPEHQRGREFRVPGPPGAPDWTSPEGAGYQGERGKDGAKLGRGARRVVPTLVALPEVDDAGRGQYAGSQQGYPGHGHVKVKDTLRLPLDGVGGGVEEDGPDGDHHADK